MDESSKKTKTDSKISVSFCANYWKNRSEQLKKEQKLSTKTSKLCSSLSFKCCCEKIPHLRLPPWEGDGKFQNMACPKRREESFKNGWPHEDKISGRQMAAAGKIKKIICCN
jgi:hypothetical protein